VGGREHMLSRAAMSCDLKCLVIKKSKIYNNTEKCGQCTGRKVRYRKFLRKSSYWVKKQ
jgi:hypothetical protein